jgi:competence protein ComGC
MPLPIKAARPGGFALPDLLLVLAALALVAAVTVPMLKKQRHESHRATCTWNLKEVTRAVLKYGEEHSDTLPKETSRRGGIWWWYKEDVKQHVGLTGKSSPADKVFACPDDRGYDEPGPFWRNEKFDFGSYNFNGVTVPGVPHIAGRTISSIVDPHRTLLMMEWTAHGPLSWHNSRTGKKNAPFYDDAESVVGFVDGHVDFIKIQYDGINPAYTRDPGPGYRYKYSGD